MTEALDNYWRYYLVVLFDLYYVDIQTNNISGQVFSRALL